MELTASDRKNASSPSVIGDSSVIDLVGPISASQYIPPNMYTTRILQTSIFIAPPVLMSKNNDSVLKIQWIIIMSVIVYDNMTEAHTPQIIKGRVLYSKLTGRHALHHIFQLGKLRPWKIH